MSFAFLMLVFLSAHAKSEDYSARVVVHSDTDVRALHERGLRFEDAKVRERIGADGLKQHQIIASLENGFVTVVGSESELERIQREGFIVTNILPMEMPEPLGGTSTAVDTIPYQFGWPRATFNGQTLYDNSPTVADINKDGQLNVSVTNAWGSFPPNPPPYLIAWRRNGTYLGGFPVALQPGSLQSSADNGISAAGDIFGDDKLEIVCGDENGYLYAFNHDGTPLNGFPMNFGGNKGVFVPALADFDNDGKLDIAFIAHDWNSPYQNADLHLLRVTANGGTEFPGFPISIGLGARNSPAVGDIDGDGNLDIVVATGAQSSSSNFSKVIAFNKTGQVLPGFPWAVGVNSAGATPTLYDINNDGRLEILVRVKPDYNNINGLYAINDRGEVLPGFPFPITFGHSTACIAVGDMTGDGVPELAYGGVEAVDSGKVWVYSLNGTLLPGFPARVFRTWVDGSVAIADVDGDGLGDVVCGTNGVGGKPGIIRAFNHLGQELPGFPLNPGDATINSFETHPTVADLDGDGDTEIIAGRADKNVYVWDTPGLYDSTKVWKTYKGNAARTGGQLRSPFSVSVEDGSATPYSFSLYQNYPNPFNPSTGIKFQIPNSSHVSLRVYDVLGREVATLVNEVKEVGTHEVTWDASSFASGVYFYRLSAGEFGQTRRLLILK